MKKYPVLLLILSLSLFSSGTADRSEILEKPIWKQLYDEFSPDPQVVDVLKGKKDCVSSIDIYFGFWCSDSENNVPPFLKLIDVIGLEDVRVNLYTVDRKKAGEKYYVEKLKVERVPAFIFYKDGKEIGRIIENPQVSLEADLLQIIF